MSDLVNRIRAGDLEAVQAGELEVQDVGDTPKANEIRKALATYYIGSGGQNTNSGTHKISKNFDRALFHVGFWQIFFHKTPLMLRWFGLSEQFRGYLKWVSALVTLRRGAVTAC
jgi:hypothetical protein